MKIVNFHEIDNPKWFESAIDVLQKNYEIVPFSEIESYYTGKNTGKNQVHITVDDGHFSTYSIIYKLLKERNLSASIFVSPKIISERTNFWYEEIKNYNDDLLKSSIAFILGKEKKELENFYSHSILKTLNIKTIWDIIHHYRNVNKTPRRECQYITTEQLLEMEKSGIIHIGAHTMDHPILANESDEVSAKEITNSAEQLSETLGRKVISFAYPNGSPKLDFGIREMKYLKKAGIKYGFSFELMSCSKNDNLLSIPRLGLYRGSSSFMEKKIKFGPIWEPIKKFLFNNEDKHRIKIKKSLGL